MGRASTVQQSVDGVELRLVEVQVRGGPSARIIGGRCLIGQRDETRRDPGNGSLGEHLCH